MNQFLVPQFIDVEAKIIGPISVRQFIIMIVGFLLMFIEYKILSFWISIICMVLTLIIFGVLAFLKINGRPFHYFLLNIIETFKKPTRRVWRKDLTDEELRKFLSQKPEEKIKEDIPLKSPVAGSHLEELALIVNTGGAYQPEATNLEYEKSKK